MSLYDIERLLDRIDDHLKPDANLALISQDASEYARLVDSVNLRIDQILAMYEARDLYQAMQLSEAEPPLMEVITMLSFKDLPAWRDLVESQNIEKFPEIKRRALPILNDLFTENIGNLGEYWDEFNGCMIKEDNAGALNIIQQILKIAPGDQNAKDNLEALEKLNFKNRFERLTEALQVNDQSAVLNELGGIWPLLKRFQPNAAQSIVWLNAKCVEVDVWLGKLNAHTTMGQWQEAVRYYREINKSITENRLQLPPEIQQKLRQAGEWAEGQEAATNEQIEFKEHYDLLQDWLGQARLPNREAELLDEKTCRKELDLLSAAWDKCHQFSDRLIEQIDQNVANHFRQRTLELQAQVEKYVRWRRLKIGAVCCLFIIVLAVVFFRVSKSRGEMEFVQELNSAMTNKLLLATSNLVTQGEQDYPGSPSEDVSKALNDGKLFITQEETKYKTLEISVTQLEQQTNTLDVATADRFLSELQKATNALIRIAPDIKKTLDLRMIVIENIWEDFKGEYAREAEWKMKNEIDSLNKEISNNFWRDDPNLNTLNGLIMDIEEKLLKLQLYTDREWVKIEINEDVIKDYDKSVMKVRDRKADLATHIRLIGEIRNVNTLGDYKKILSDLNLANLLSKDEKKGLNLTLTKLGEKYDDVILQGLVFSGDFTHYKAVQNQGELMFPTDIIPPNLMASLQRAGTHPSIYGLKALPKNSFILAVRPNQFSSFYIVNSNGKWWEINRDGKSGDWDDPNVQRRWTLNLVNTHFIVPKIIKENEEFEKGINGLDKLWKNNVIGKGQFTGSLLKYMSEICNAIDTGKMEPIIGAWKLKCIFENLFLKLPGNFQPAVGSSLWQYGMPLEFAMAFEKDFLKEVEKDEKLEPHTWMKYHPESLHRAKSEEDYLKFIQSINKFAMKYKSSFDQLTALRLAYNEILKSGVDFVGFHHATHGQNLVDRVKGKHIVGLSPSGEWVIKGKDNSELSPFSPLFVLKSDYGQDTRSLPEIPEAWHKYPAILTY